MSQNQPEGELYRRIKLLGEGSFGKAYLVECLKDSSKCVIKQMDLSEMSEEEKRETIKEAKILELFRHPNIIKFREVYKTKRGKLCIVMEYAEGGDLQKRIKDQNGVFFEESQILDWFTQLCLALKHVHDRKIIHRDLKSPNIFLTKDNTVKLGDFGIAKILSHTKEKAKTIVGTPYYLSPEIIEGKEYTFKTDLWSLGVILYEMCALGPPFKANNLSFLALKIVKGNYSQLPAKFSGELSSIIAKLLNVDPNKRPSVHEILSLPVITSRIKNFLSDTLRLNEFSHTIMHKQKFIENKGKEYDLVKQPQGFAGGISPKISNMPHIEPKSNQKVKPATPGFNNNYHNNNLNKGTPAKIPALENNNNNNINNFNNNNNLNKNANIQKKTPFFKEVAERELKPQILFYEPEEKKEPPRKLAQNLNPLAKKDPVIPPNIKKNPPPVDPSEQGGILVIPNFNNPKEKKPKKKPEKKDFAINEAPAKIVSDLKALEKPMEKPLEKPMEKLVEKPLEKPVEKPLDPALKRQEKEKEREEQRRKMIEDMKKKSKQKEENKEVMIEWFGQIIPVDKKKAAAKKGEDQAKLQIQIAEKPFNEGHLEVEKPDLEAEKPLNEGHFGEIVAKKSTSYEIINKRDQEADIFRGIVCNESNKENEKEEDQKNQEEIIDSAQKSREKWFKCEPEKPETLPPTYLEYQKSDDYIEQMINELQEIVDGVTKVIDSKDWNIPEDKLFANNDRDDDIFEFLDMKETEKSEKKEKEKFSKEFDKIEELRKLLTESLGEKAFKFSYGFVKEKMERWGIENIYQIYEKKHTQSLMSHLSEEDILKYLPLLLTLLIMERES